MLRGWVRLLDVRLEQVFELALIKCFVGIKGLFG
jgi:hypothetical protein